MIQALSIALSLTLALAATGAQTVDETKPYGRASVTVVDSKTKKETLLMDNLKSAAESNVSIHLEANTKCEAIVAAFSNVDGSLANGWRPVIMSLEQWKEQTLPSVGEPWPWIQAGQPFEIFVTFLPREMPTAALSLVAKLREGKGDADVQKLQAWQLREEFRRWAASDSAVAPRPESAPTPMAATVAARPESAPAPIAGTARGVDLPWRAHARTVNFTDEKPGVIIYRYDVP
jgi:hypothetical protein